MDQSTNKENTWQTKNRKNVTPLKMCKNPKNVTPLLGASLFVLVSIVLVRLFV